MRFNIFRRRRQPDDNRSTIPVHEWYSLLVKQAAPLREYTFSAPDALSLPPYDPESHAEPRTGDPWVDTPILPVTGGRDVYRIHH